MAALVRAYRDILFDGRVPAAVPLLVAGTISVVVLGIGYWLHRRMQHELIDHV